MTELNPNQSPHAVETEARGRQAQKSADMRRRICQGAAACIAAEGYHRMSIQQVVTRCGISAGALQHHYPTKLDLVAAAAEHLLRRSVRWFADAKMKLSRGEKGYEEAVFRSWRDLFKSEEYAALLEIMVAARTDEALRTRLAPSLDAWRAAIEMELAALFPGDADRADQMVLMTISRAMMTGLVVQDDLTARPEEIETVLRGWLSLLTGRMRPPGLKGR